MRYKHNKKRNTVFLYEALVRELTKSIVKRDEVTKKNILSIFKEHFNKDSLLAKELELYNVLLKTNDLKEKLAEKLVQETKKQHKGLDQKKIFKEQSTLIKKVNVNVSKTTFSNFVPFYKDMATIYQLFNQEMKPKDRVLLEEKVVVSLTKNKQEKIKEDVKPVDSLVYKTFVKKYNSTYGSLKENQKTLLSKYISSFGGSDIELKLYLNEEIGRLKNVISSSLRNNKDLKDKNLREKTEKVLEIINEMSKKEINSELIKMVAKVQNLTEEFAN
tara:strand:- start:915 stop:1736 length:822 start_codon:yes stop_codon:yes gene_type:complete